MDNDLFAIIITIGPILKTARPLEAGYLASITQTADYRMTLGLLPNFDDS